MVQFILHPSILFYYPILSTGNLSIKKNNKTEQLTDIMYYHIGQEGIFLSPKHFQLKIVH